VARVQDQVLIRGAVYLIQFSKLPPDSPRLRPFEIEAVVDYIRNGIMQIMQEPVEMDMSTMSSEDEHDHTQHFGEDTNAPMPNGLAGIIGTEMRAWRSVLTAKKMADISEYLFGSIIRPDQAQDK